MIIAGVTKYKGQSIYGVHRTVNICACHTFTENILFLSPDGKKRVELSENEYFALTSQHLNLPKWDAFVRYDLRSNKVHRTPLDKAIEELKQIWS